MNIFISPKNIPSRMFCPICGIVNDDNDKCCKSCGFKFEKNHQNKPNPAINTNTSYIDPLYDSLTGFLSSLIPQIIEMARKEIVYLVIPAILIAVLTYFGINQYVIELIAGSDGFTKMGNCFPKYGNICNIAGFETNTLFFISAFGSLFVVGGCIGSLAGTIRSLGVSKYLSQVSGLVSTISSTVSGEKKQGIPIILLGLGAGIVFGVIFSSTYIMSLSIIGLLINSLISGRMGLLSPILQYAHRDIMRKFFDRNNTHLIDESSVSIGLPVEFLDIRFQLCFLRIISYLASSSGLVSLLSEGISFLKRANSKVHSDSFSHSLFRDTHPTTRATGFRT